MERLREIGFTKVGRWFLIEDRIDYLLTEAIGANILYAFISNETVLYVGKSTRPLGSRLNNYKYAHSSQLTNVRNNKYINEYLRKDIPVDIYALENKKNIKYGVFTLNIAAGLEDSIIKIVDPIWNNNKIERNTTSK